MQSKPLKFNPICGTAFKTTECFATTFRSESIRQSIRRWFFNPWTGAERASQDVVGDPYGLLIHDGVGPVDAFRQGVGPGPTKCPRHPRYQAKPFCPDCRHEAEGTKPIVDTPAAAREALHDVAERESTHPLEHGSPTERRLLQKAESGRPPSVDHPLQAVFALAIEQATRGKGVRHGGEATPFLEQPWAHYSKMHGRGFLTGQAAKKLEEAASTRTGEAFITEALGALVYIGMAILKEKA